MAEAFGWLPSMILVGVVIANVLCVTVGAFSLGDPAADQNQLSMRLVEFLLGAYGAILLLAELFADYRVAQPLSRRVFVYAQATAAAVLGFVHATCPALQSTALYVSEVAAPLVWWPLFFVAWRSL